MISALNYRPCVAFAVILQPMSPSNKSALNMPTSSTSPSAHRRLIVLNVVGLTFDMIGENTPNLRSLAHDGFAVPMQTILPAVTC